MGEGVPQADVIRVLKAHKVFVSLDAKEAHMFTLVKGEFLESHVLKGEVVPRLLQYFSRKLNIPIHHFWHPEVPEAEAEAQAEAEKEKDGDT